MPVRKSPWRTNLKAVVASRRSLAGASQLPKSILAAGVATLGAMTYALVREGSSARDFQPSTSPSSSSSSASSSELISDGITISQQEIPTASAGSAPFLSLDGRAVSIMHVFLPATTNAEQRARRGLVSQVSAEKVPKYVLANSGLDAEQKLSVALCRRQAWLRALQFGPLAMLWSYAGIVLVESAGLTKLPRGSRTAGPLGAAVFGATVGAYYGGLEGKPMMNAALTARPIAGVHHRRGEQEDALVHVRCQWDRHATPRDQPEACALPLTDRCRVCLACLQFIREGTAAPAASRG